MLVRHFRLAIIDDNIWVPMRNDNCIDVYNNTEVKISSFSIKNPFGVEMASNKEDIFVSCWRGIGLHVMNRRGDSCQITDGSFSGISAYTDYMYALEYNKSVIIEYKSIDVEKTSSESLTGVKWKSHMTE